MPTIEQIDETSRIVEEAAVRAGLAPEEIRSLLVEHWTSPVRFRETIEALYADGARVFVEAGPRGNMTAFVEDILRGRPACAVAAAMPLGRPRSAKVRATSSISAARLRPWTIIRSRL